MESASAHSAGVESSHVSAAEASHRVTMKSTADRYRTSAIKCMIVAVSVEERSAINHNWRVEAPSERVVEESAARNERKSIKPRIPIPSWTPPARAIPAIHVIALGRIDVVQLQGGRRVSTAATACPNARVLFMSSRDPSQIASALISAGMK